MAVRGICSVDGCGKPAVAKGFCNPHYCRVRRNGDPEGKQVSPGTLMAWLEEHKADGGNACLLWPFASRNGYGAIKVDGVGHNAPRVMCRLAHGEPPGDEYDAAHSCGNRLCCNPQHLRWATRSENHMDKVEHGTSSRGEGNASAKLSEDQVRAIRSSRGAVSQRSLARRFGVDQSTICDIQSRKLWHWLD